MRATLIHNPDAGAGEQSRDVLDNALRDAGIDVTYQSTAAGDIEPALRDPGDVIIVAGGDGTVARVARRLSGRAVPLAIVPLGTANNIATSLGIDGTPGEIIRGLRGAERRGLDVGIARAPWGSANFVESAGLGVIARLLRDAAEDQANDPSATGSGTHDIEDGAQLLRRALKREKPRRWHVDADGEDLSGQYLLALVLNIAVVGPRVMLAPDADPGDGLLDLVLVGEDDRDALGAFLRRLKRGEPAVSPIHSRRVKRVRMQWKGKAGHLDDEVWPERGRLGPLANRWPIVELEIVDPPVTVLVPTP